MAAMTGKQALLRLSCVLLAAQFLASPVQAVAEPDATVDPHTLFEARCQRCHGHAGDFAREHLFLEDGNVLGKRTGGGLARFLQRHQGGLAENEMAALFDAFQRQLTVGPLFQDRCRACHLSARELAKHQLILSDEGLMGRYSGNPMAAFLQRHGTFSDEEAERLHGMLLWHRQTIEATQHGG